MPVEYKVLTIVERMRPGDTGGFEQYYQHTIKTKGGTILRVDVSEKDFTPEKVAPLLLKAAQNADAILGLK